MRLAALLLLATLVGPATGRAQPYRASVLWTAPDSASSAGTGADSAAAGTAQLPDSARAFHAPAVAAFDPQAGEPSMAAPILGSLVCGSALGFAFGMIGNSTDTGHSEDIPYGAFIGYLIGETIGVPIGAHLGNARRGNIAGDLGISILGHIAALGLASIGGSAGYVAGISVQILATAVTEQKVGRLRATARHEREQAAEAAKSP